MNTRPLISRNKREGRYAGFACGSHYRERDVSVHPCLPRSSFAFHRLVEKLEWCEDKAGQLGI